MARWNRIARYAVCLLLVAAFFLLYEIRLFQWQVVQGRDFEEQARSNRTDVIELDATRGQILDRNGNVLSGNRSSYDIVFNALKLDWSNRNAVILRAVDLLEEQGETWRDELPILLSDGEFFFPEDREDDISLMKSTLNLADYATAEQCMAELAEVYGCRGYATEDARTVASVRYGMTRDGFSRNTPYVLARDVSADTVGIVSQRESTMPGVEPRISVTRYYGDDPALAPHVLGVVGSISAEQYAAAREDGTVYDPVDNISGYKLNDSMGQGGLEAVFENQLRGIRGEETIYTDDSGNVESTAVTLAPQEGNTVVTTLDSELQRVANLSLERNILGNNVARDCTSGAVVALDVKDFGVLACSSYPSFSLEDYFTDYNLLSQDTRTPLVNKALQGRYTPGSIFKPMVALAALQEGVVSSGTTYICEGVFKYYDMELGCLSNYGPQNVYSALAESCNVYFCNVGLLLGIERIDAYAEFFGLGFPTGVELGENTGIIANPQEYGDRHGGESWTSGVTAQAAIGQSDNMFTPIQLASYVATIAQGGKRYQTHFLKEITNYTGDKVIERHQPKLLYDAGLSADVVGAVREGMMGVASYGTARAVFGDYPVSIACKTGTAETSQNKYTGTQPNISFICFAPAEDPEIAVAVMLEYGNEGDWAKHVAKDVLDQYFGFYSWDEDGNKYDADGNMVDEEGEIIRSREELEEERRRQEPQEDDQPDDQPASDETVENPPENLEDAPQDDGRAHAGDVIPDQPYTGEEESEAPITDETPAAPEPESSRKPDVSSPYYSGP